MRSIGWFLVGGLLAANVACAQQVSSPASTSAVSQAPASQIGPPAHPATEDQVREYLSLIRADKLAHETLDSSLRAMQTTSAPYYPAAMWADMRAEFQKMDVAAIYVQVYQRYMSQSDMQAVIDFYRSPAGHSLLEAQPLAIRDAQAIVRQKATQTAQAIVAKYKDQIEAAKKQYDSHPSQPAVDSGSTPHK